MKKKMTSLMLNKKSISTFQDTFILGGNYFYEHYTSKHDCKTKCCSSEHYQDCTVTYDACITEPRFCGMF